MQIRSSLDRLESWAAQCQVAEEAVQQMDKVDAIADLLALPRMYLTKVRLNHSLQV